MAICSGPHVRTVREEELPEPEELANTLFDHIKATVFLLGMQHPKKDYRAAANLCGEGITVANGDSHHVVMQTAFVFDQGQTLAANIAETAALYGVEEVTKEHLLSLIHHPLNLCKVGKMEHGQINKVFNKKNEELKVSHYREHVRTQSYLKQMTEGLEVLLDKSPEAYRQHVRRTGAIIAQNSEMVAEAVVRHGRAMQDERLAACHRMIQENTHE